MPSLRQPVGPLPASIYWRRRVVVIVAAVAVAALVIWLMADQGGGGDGAKDKAAQAVPTQSQNQTPAQAITPGASPSGPANNSRPGSGSGGGSASGGAVGGSGGGDVSLSTGGTTGGTAPALATGGAAGGTGGAGGAGTGGAAGTGGGAGTGGSASGGSTSGGAGGNGGQPPVNTTEIMALPVCASSQVTLNLASAQNSYQPKDKPKLALTINNSSAANCRVDLGRTASAITVTASNGERIWSSGDCPADRSSAWVQLPANGGLTETFGWDRVRSKPQCATADPAAAPAGNYLVVADLTGLSGGQASARSPIRLEN
ncbi:hypothetical protein [Kitasatospora purpeofusca]|uniref:hypothetical protein n=1 Tax=Kitasatospora purpeofusca TaxID=67352 RepID=UPI00224F9766|nr:hypothetical protein [Kitasatospora purpeofusca]MCX4753551.1 hypothetical protein [Kitasatospora purpeofusca]WSR33043.1 hypothetical protein OG715_19845 [Kitasatospora purpeofusca]WSR41112.1 hypothetical protein OG196_19540 [Kitasatospora purpeofusca]